MNLDGLESIFLIVVFGLFGIQTTAAGVGWVFARWREFQDMKDWYDSAEDTGSDTGS